MHHNRLVLVVPEVVRVHWALARVHFGVGTHYLLAGEAAGVADSASDSVGAADTASDSVAAIVAVGSGCLARSDLAQVPLSVEDSSAEAD